MRKFLRILLLLVPVLMLILHFTGNNHVYRTLAMTIFRGKLGPDINELHDFPTREIANLKPEPWKQSVFLGQLKAPEDILAKAIKNESSALLVIQNDSIRFEQYFDTYDAQTLSNSFSMAKSLTGLLIGCALKDGYIKDLDEPIGNYLNEFKHEPYTSITIRHLLMMSSGLDFKESYGSLFGWPAKAYYGSDVNATTHNAPKIHEPGTVYSYKGGDTQILGMILEKAIGKRVSEYASHRLWQKIGAEQAAFWSLDRENGMEKVSCCYYASARDFARLGKLMMQYGKWNGEQLLDSAYIAQCIKAAPLQTEAGKPNTQYGYQWWIMEHKGLAIYYARGIKGQYIFCIPAKNMVVVRLGHKRADKTGDELPDDILDYLDLGLSVQEKVSVQNEY